MTWLISKKKKKRPIPSDHTRYPYGDSERKRSTDNPKGYDSKSETTFPIKITPYETTSSPGGSPDISYDSGGPFIPSSGECGAVMPISTTDRGSSLKRWLKIKKG
jgi:hypothetical protein